MGEAVFTPIVQPQRIRCGKVNALLGHPATVGQMVANIPGSVAPVEIVAPEAWRLVASSQDKGPICVEGQSHGIAGARRGLAYASKPADGLLPFPRTDQFGQGRVGRTQQAASGHQQEPCSQDSRTGHVVRKAMGGQASSEKYVSEGAGFLQTTEAVEGSFFIRRKWTPLAGRQSIKA